MEYVYIFVGMGVYIALGQSNQKLKYYTKFCCCLIWPITITYMIILCMLKYLEND